MRLRTALVLSVAVGLLGLGLRSAIPVTPVDEPFRNVLRFYDDMKPPRKKRGGESVPSNKPETSVPY